MPRLENGKQDAEFGSTIFAIVMTHDIFIFFVTEQMAAVINLCMF